MARLFDDKDNRIDFRNGSIVVGQYDPGSQYLALAGDDVVWLPFTNRDIQSTGFERFKAFYAGAGNDWVAIGGTLPPGDVGGYNYSYTLDGGAGDDTLYGHNAAAPDYFSGGTGDDYIEDYGFGTYVHFSGRASNYKITYGKDGLLTVRDLKGSDGVDTIRGTIDQISLVFSDRTIRLIDWVTKVGETAGLKVTAANARGEDASDRLKGLSGNDKMSGEGGNDILVGAEGNDLIHGNAGRDVIYGDTGKSATAGGADVIYGDAGDDRLYGEAGNDRLDGGTGRDRLYGGAGNDRLFGGANDDRLEGGLGADILTGGTGWDIFIWRSIKETGATSSRADLVRDFRPGDKLSFSAIDADETVTGNQAFTFIGSAAFTGAGQIAAIHSGGETRLLLNTDGDSRAEAIIRVAGLHHVTEDWFLL